MTCSHLMWIACKVRRCFNFLVIRLSKVVFDYTKAYRLSSVYSGDVTRASAPNHYQQLMTHMA